MIATNGSSPIEDELDLSAEQTERLTAILAALASVTRLRIVLALNLTGEMSVNNLCAATNTTQSHASHQLRILRNLQLVQLRRVGNQRLYSVSEELTELLRGAVDFVASLS